LPYNQDVLTEEDKQWISQRLEKVETTPLTEFHKWASPVELRQKSHAAAIRALDTEVEALSDRLKNLEGR
jgi:ABC-type enterochelin transport system ATPase subunit